MGRHEIVPGIVVESDWIPRLRGSHIKVIAGCREGDGYFEGIIIKSGNSEVTVGSKSLYTNHEYYWEAPGYSPIDKLLAVLDKLENETGKV